MFKALGSVKLTVVLLIILAIASIIGTLIPQTWTEQQYVERYGIERYKFMENLQLLDVYHSYWYSALLAVLCVNLVVCSIQGFGPLVKSLTRSSSTAGRVTISDLPFYEKIKLSGGSTESDRVIQKIKDTFSRGLYKVKYTDAENGVYYFERGKLGRLGPLITHASIIIILIGGIVVATFGFKDYRNIPVGDIVHIPNTDFHIRADDFKVEFYPDRSPKEFTSVLTVIEDGAEKLTKTIEVNSPLKYKGIKFYQSSYGQLNAGGMGHIVQVELSKKVPGESETEFKIEAIGKYEIHIGDAFQVPDSELKIEIANMVPDFVRDGEGNVSTRSDTPNNPAAFLKLYEGDEQIDEVWSFLKFPDFHGAGKSDYILKFVSMGQDAHSEPARYYTGLQIGYHPGLPVIWVGCVTMVLGMFLAFYMSFKRVWIRVSGGNVEIGGRSYKDRARFDKELKRLKAALDQS
ncbi:cytochrome c biogenesis protein ResB [Candidatus Poribacteria bacterium]